MNYTDRRKLDLISETLKQNNDVENDIFDRGDEMELAEHYRRVILKIEEIVKS